jgi:uncharacterized repeat protein (TIGR01451 family)
MVLRRPSLLLASAVGVACAAYARSARPPPIALDIDRAVSNTHPEVGEEIEVTVTVRNTGEALLPDCCLLDGVPSGLVVTDGSPRYGTALRPGKATTFSYTLTAARGEHTFEPILVIARDYSASVERLTRVAASEQTTITYMPSLRSLDGAPLRAQADRFGGQITTSARGSGVEISATREYRQGDPRSRIDWNRVARTGELSTLLFREERAPRVMLVIDARPEAYLAPPESPESPL